MLATVATHLWDIVVRVCRVTGPIHIYSWQDIHAHVHSHPKEGADLFLRDRCPVRIWGCADPSFSILVGFLSDQLKLKAGELFQYSLQEIITLPQ
jgi:hypothetical protein